MAGQADVTHEVDPLVATEDYVETVERGSGRHEADTGIDAGGFRPEYWDLQAEVLHRDR